MGLFWALRLWKPALCSSQARLGPALLVFIPPLCSRNLLFYYLFSFLKRIRKCWTECPFQANKAVSALGQRQSRARGRDRASSGLEKQTRKSWKHQPISPSNSNRREHFFCGWVSANTVKATVHKPSQNQLVKPVPTPPLCLTSFPLLPEAATSYSTGAHKNISY